jgi:hypothetical protein
MKKLSDTRAVMTCGSPIRVDAMARLVYRSALCGALALACSFAFGCTVDADTDAEDASETAADEGAARETEGGEDVAESQEAITACYQVHHHGGNAWEQDYEILMGCSCGPGYVRDFNNVWNNGAGSCNAVGWASPDPHDCRVRVHIHDSAFWAWGDCNVQVEQKLACPHNKCTTGAALAPECSPAVASICSVDPYCCTTAWDGLCVQEVRTVTNSLACPAGTCGHSLCSTGVKLTSGCDVPPASSSCVASICAVDPYCCSTSWDGLCVGEVASVCGKNCN